jgi:YgiT-type zinc finger domain-containing protein
MAGRTCPICRDPVRIGHVPVSVRRHGRVVFRLKVPAWRCPACGYLDIDEAVREEVVATLERHTRPGDDIVFPIEE